MSRTSRIAGAVIGVVALAGSLAACGGDSLEQEKGSGSSGGGSEKGSLVVGSASFTESKVLAELYAQILGDAGYDTSITTVKNRELYEPSLEKGEIDVVPEYAATITEFLNAKVNGAEKAQSTPLASPDADATVAALEKLAGPLGLKVLPAGKAVDQNAFAVSKEFAEKNKLTTLSDLGKSKLEVKIAAGDECEVRPFCAPGLKKTYGIDVTGIDPKGVGTPQSKQAVRDGKVQLVLTTTTDAVLDGLVFLEDDKKLQNADNVLPVLNAKDAGSPEIAAALGKLTDALTTEDLAELNRKVDAERAKPADVAKEYLETKGLIEK
ncbi:ABC transporter substrate-binding protein [Streptomyces griseus]|uniref:ABC transporter substrate-binding protein n=1 Tax=Streptomyces griseus subsp. griseus (strain JCM 4626 / CBS 651.72 / NBRC 13350 / KCC S-0626 / ISP 5235) TaxID=455632 RepID=B1VSH5_STRGG|nr:MULTISPECIES: ABC transporter substrate-binding protein [Streptomyces]MYR16098.1 amino acid ABC transporter substrate-binding protein [Streptomyces sp. SID724]MBW3706584.1 amino acid ABC transporter substrate-binding protein [Streptomyces griseus]NEB55164.1 ABC transporter substrate-binding protein [Streptomyces griseus]SCE52715.1 osmoprotectant transport system substrate-binding protein [Streptomyces sp. OspMP-M43]SEE73118.1 osmoprotectant transport system substrate-binding protein [Strept